MQRALRAKARLRSRALSGLSKQSSGLLRRNHYAVQASAQRAAAQRAERASHDERPAPSVPLSPQALRQRPSARAHASPPGGPATVLATPPASPFKLGDGAEAAWEATWSEADGAQGGKEAQDATAALAAAAAAAAEKGAEALVSFVAQQLAGIDATPLGTKA